jgi:hypothetical protein
MPAHFEELSKMVTEEMIAKEVICGPDVDRHVEAVRKYADAGYDHVYVHQIGPDQEGMIEFYATEVMPRLRTGSTAGEVAAAR